MSTFSPPTVANPRSAFDWSLPFVSPARKSVIFGIHMIHSGIHYYLDDSSFAPASAELCYRNQPQKLNHIVFLIFPTSEKAAAQPTKALEALT
jgi:hypothetical protein